MKFTGERFILGQAVGDITIEHMQRYKSIISIIKDKKVLDAACGEGYGSNILAQYATSVVGIDVSNEAVQYAQEHYEKENLKYICASIENIPLKDHSVDVVVSFETIEHVNAQVQEKFLQEIKRVLKPDGILIMSSPDKRTYSDLRNYNNEYHIHEMYKNEFEELLKSYFKYIKLFSQGICNQRIGLIKSEENITPKFLDKVKIDDKDLLYFIAICSMERIDNKTYNDLNTIVPFSDIYPARLLINKGNGFSEKDVIYSKINMKKNKFIAFFNLEDVESICKLRFDPTEEHGGIFKIIYIKSNIEGLTIKNINAIKTDSNGDLFFTMDPQYEIDGNYFGLKWIEIGYEVQTIKSSVIANYYENKFKEKNEILAQCKIELENKNFELNMIKKSYLYKIYQVINRIKNKIKR